MIRTFLITLGCLLSISFVISANADSDCGFMECETGPLGAFGASSGAANIGGSTSNQQSSISVVNINSAGLSPEITPWNSTSSAFPTYSEIGNSMELENTLGFFY
jgi:hypothetical protein